MIDRSATIKGTQSTAITIGSFATSEPATIGRKSTRRVRDAERDQHLSAVLPILSTSLSAMAAPYLLDTTVLLHWTRDSSQAQVIEANFQLSNSAMRPLICEVSLGEMLAFSLGRRWGAQKLNRLAEIERNAVIVVATV